MLVGGLASTPTAVAIGPSPSTSSYIVVLRDAPGAGSVVDEQVRQRKSRVSHVFRNALHGYSASLTQAEVEILLADPRIDYVESDHAVSIAEPGFEQPPQPAQVVPTGVDRVDADRSSTKAGNGSGVVSADIAIMDTGVDIFHPDLNLAGGIDCTNSREGIDDFNGHGTHVAGIAAARDNDIGVVGVAPGARLWAVKVFDTKGNSSTSRILCGIEWVTAHADVINVVNMSFVDDKGSDDGDCGRTNHDSMHSAICGATRAGVTVVAAAGNATADAAGFTPAAYDEVITVSALADYDGRPGGRAKPTCFDLGKDDRLATFSNFGADVDLIAPGACILSTWPSSIYATNTGTSMAAPHVTGGAALYLSTHPGETPEQVRTALVRLGSTDRSAVGDPDGIKEPLLDVGKL